MPLHEGAKPGTKEFGENVATEIEAGKPQKHAVAIAYSEAERKKKSADADDPDIAPAVAETDIHALNRIPVGQVHETPDAPPAGGPITSESLSVGVPTYDPGTFRNPIPETARSTDVAPPLSAQNAVNRAFWNGRR